MSLDIWRTYMSEDNLDDILKKQAENLKKKAKSGKVLTRTELKQLADYERGAKEPATEAERAKKLGCSVKTLERYKKDPNFPRFLDEQKVYIDHKKALSTAGRKLEGGNAPAPQYSKDEIFQLRAQMMVQELEIKKAEKELQRMKSDIARGKYILMEDHCAILMSQNQPIRTILDNLPAQLPAKCERQSKEFIRSEVVSRLQNAYKQLDKNAEETLATLARLREENGNAL